MATTYYMALFLDTLLQLSRFEIINQVNLEFGYISDLMPTFPRLDSLAELESNNLIESPTDYAYEIIDPLNLSKGSVITLPKHLQETK